MALYCESKDMFVELAAIVESQEIQGRKNRRLPMVYRQIADICMDLNDFESVSYGSCPCTCDTALVCWRALQLFPADFGYLCRRSRQLISLPARSCRYTNADHRIPRCNKCGSSRLGYMRLQEMQKVQPMPASKRSNANLHLLVLGEAIKASKGKMHVADVVLQCFLPT